MLDKQTPSYKRPTQQRSVQSERAFLEAFDKLMAKQGYKNTTIDQIALEAGLTREAFMKRFGTKHQALLVLYERYCEQASLTMAGIVNSMHKYPSLDRALIDMSSKLERLITSEFSSNRAMHEDFMERLHSHELTQGIFLECVAMMGAAQAQFLANHSYSKAGAFAAAQLLVTINFNHVLKAMPGLPRDPAMRHTMIGGIIQHAIQY